MITDGVVSLRAVERGDLETLRDWRNREDYRRFFREYRELNMDDQIAWYTEDVVGNHRTLMFVIEEADGGRTIGACGLCYINWVHRHGDLSLYIGRDGVYIDPGPTGYAWRSMDLLFELGFGRLGLNKVWTEIYEFDERKAQLFTDYGFARDAVLRENYFYDGRYWNSHIWSILAAEWSARHSLDG